LLLVFLTLNYFYSTGDEWCTWKSLKAKYSDTIIKTVVKDCEPFLHHYAKDEKKKFVDSLDTACNNHVKYVYNKVKPKRESDTRSPLSKSSSSGQTSDLLFDAEDQDEDGEPNGEDDTVKEQDNENDDADEEELFAQIKQLQERAAAKKRKSASSSESYSSRGAKAPRRGSAKGTK
jgi:hypothetical protein